MGKKQTLNEQRIEIHMQSYYIIHMIFARSVQSQHVQEYACNRKIETYTQVNLPPSTSGKTTSEKIETPSSVKLTVKYDVQRYTMPLFFGCRSVQSSWASQHLINAVYICLVHTASSYILKQLNFKMAFAFTCAVNLYTCSWTRPACMQIHSAFLLIVTIQSSLYTDLPAMSTSGSSNRLHSGFSESRF